MLLLFKLSIVVSISDVSFTLLLIFKTSEQKHFSTKIDKFFIATPHPLVITLTGLPTLCVLIKPYTLPRLTWVVSKTLHQLWSRALFCFHFLIHGVTFFEIHLKDYNVTVEKKFFQVGDQSFQYNHHYQGQKNVILYSVYDMFLMCLFVCQSFSFLISDIVFNSSIVGLEYIILCKFYESL